MKNMIRILLLLFFLFISFVCSIIISSGSFIEEEKLSVIYVDSDESLRKVVNIPKIEPGNYKFINEKIDWEAISPNAKLLKYTNDWNKHYNNLSSFLVSKNCPECKFETDFSNNDKDSTKRDFILTSAFYQAYNMVPFIRSLRQTGSKCSLVIFADETISEKINETLESFLVSCGVTLIDIGNIDQISNNDTKIFRHSVYLDFIFKRRKFINRVIEVDMYDTIFQMDPFNKNWDYSSLGISEEPNYVEGKQYFGSIALIGNPMTNKFVDFTKQTNSGVLLGTAQQLIRFGILFLRFYNSITPAALQQYKKTGDLEDQGIIDILCKTEYLTKNGVGCNTKYHYSAIQNDERKITSFELGKISFSTESKIHPILHNYDRNRQLLNSVTEKCKKEFPFFDDYVRFKYAVDPPPVKQYVPISRTNFTQPNPFDYVPRKPYRYKYKSTMPIFWIVFLIVLFVIVVIMFMLICILTF